MIKIAIVEDEAAVRDQLTDYVRRYTRQYGTEFEVTCFTDGDEILENYRPAFDIIFLDVEMKRLNGMETAQRIRELDDDVLLIFITNMAQYAIKGYSVGALDYVLKPVPYFAFSQQLQKAVNQLARRARHYLAVPVDGGMRRLDTAAIYYMESDGHKVCFYTEDGDFIAPGALKSFEEKLANRPFARCNSGYLVNLAQVRGVQPPVIKLCTTRKERLIRMPYKKGSVTKTTKILFPIVVTVLAGLVAPASVALVGFLMFGNLLRECGVLNALSETAQNVLANLITIVLGLTVAGQMTADKFVQPDTLLILALGLVAFVFDTVGGVLFAKLLNLFLPEGKKINPMIGAAGISAFPMSGRVVNQMGLAEDNQNFLLMYSISVNVSGQIASVIAGGLILTLMNGYV